MLSRCSARLSRPLSSAVAVALAVLFFSARPVLAQDLLPPSPDSLRALPFGAETPPETEPASPAETRAEVNPWRVAAVTGVAVGGGLAVLETQRRRWWEDRNPEFRIINDWEYVRWADKFGHIYSSAFFTRFYRSSFRWAGLSDTQVAVWGATAAWTQMLYYEVLDGFGPQWGFSPGDLAFNTVGVGFTTAQAFVPALEPFTFKASYWPSGWEGKNFTDDYEGQTLWLAANLRGLAPDRAKHLFPEWLGLAVGYAARDRDERDFLTTSYVWLALDIEPTILPLEGPVWDTIADWLHYVHLPAPGIRLTPRPAFVLVAY